MYISDSNRQRITPCSVHKILRLFRICIVILRQSFFVYRLISHMSKLGLNRNVICMEIINTSLYLRNIFLIRKSGSVTHYRVHAVIYRILQDRHIASVIPVQDNRHSCLFRHRFHHITVVFKGSVPRKSSSKRDNDRGAQFLCGIDNSHQHLCIPHVKMRNCVMSFTCFLFPISDI